MNITEASPAELVELLRDYEFALPCDFGHGPLVTQSIGEHDDPAQWVMHLKPCACGKFACRLACTRCKDERMKGDIYLECSTCGAVSAGGSEAYWYIEPLEKK